MPGNVGKDDNSIRVENNVVKVPCADIQQNHGKEMNLWRGCARWNKRKGSGKTKLKETNSYV